MNTLPFTCQFGVDMTRTSNVMTRKNLRGTYRDPYTRRMSNTLCKIPVSHQHPNELVKYSQAALIRLTNQLTSNFLSGFPTMTRDALIWTGIGIPWPCKFQQNAMRNTFTIYQEFYLHYKAILKLNRPVIAEGSKHVNRSKKLAMDLTELNDQIVALSILSIQDIEISTLPKLVIDNRSENASLSREYYPFKTSTNYKISSLE